MSRIREIAALACADVRHEWRMSLCMVLAVLAIATPLLLFFGLKSGVVETLRHRLLNSPSTLEIVPSTEKRLDEAWFERMRKNGHVAFVVPRTRRLAAQASFALQGDGKSQTLDLVPTLEGDVLLARYGVPVPKAGQCVLSAPAAKKLGATAGDSLRCTVARSEGRESVDRAFNVASVLPDRAGTVAAAYVRLEDLEKVERFRDGLAVPDLGWPGRDPLAYPAVRDAVVALPAPLDAASEAMLCQDTGFVRLARLGSGPDAAATPGVPEGWTRYLLETVNALADAGSMEVLADRVRGRGAFVMPYSSRLRLRAVLADGETTLRVLPGGALGRPLPGIPVPVADGGGWQSFSSEPASRILLASPALANRLGPEVQLCAFMEPGKRGSAERNEVSFKAQILPLEGVPEDAVLVAPALLGQLSLLEARPLSNGAATGGRPAFLLGRLGYSGFRMYAAGLNHVAPLARELEEEGIDARTQADRIEEVVSLERSLNLLFLIIAVASLAGGMGCLVSSVYANIERKRRELAVLRLLGVHGATLAVFPAVEAVLLASAGFVAGLVLFHSLAFAINAFFGSQLESGESFCYLALAHQGAAFCLALALAVCAGLAAARRIMRIEPAESLRDE